ncbi:MULTISPECIES: toxin-antitoxin system, toxin component [unclassified Streptomyces]|uniref:toxin-antitoxin system, toxin component n=1 Tax=unclassified Streptomyces TaxID=2593676 RepID=UPI0033B9E875
MRTRKAKEMRKLIGQLTDGLVLPVPADPDALFAALIDRASVIRGRQVILLKEEFPHRTATGLWLDMPEHDIILVDRRAAPVHKLAIICHEIWHMIKGDCGHHADGVPAAARTLSDRADFQQAARTVAARTEFHARAEQDAETFALRAVTQLRVWLEGDPGSPSGDRTEIADRIGASLGHRRFKV